MCPRQEALQHPVAVRLLDYEILGCPTDYGKIGIVIISKKGWVEELTVVYVILHLQRHIMLSLLNIQFFNEQKEQLQHVLHLLEPIHYKIIDENTETFHPLYKPTSTYSFINTFHTR